MSEHRLPLVAAAILAAAAILHGLHNVTLPLSGDEAYYWVWSRHLQAGYYDHPPAIAFVIWLTTHLFGDDLFGVRMTASLCMAGALFFMVLTARDIGGTRVALLMLVGGLVAPAVHYGFTLATPDGPLALFWAAGLYFGLRAVAGEGRWHDFLLAGLCAGLAMTSKYTGVLLPASVAVFLLVRRRDLFLSPRLWAAVAIAALVVAPVMWWNVQNDFISFRFQAAHAARESRNDVLRNVGEFVGGQALLLSPVFFVLLIWRAAAWRSWWNDNARLFLMLCCLLPLALFLERSFISKIELNWATPAYISAAPLIAQWVAERKLRRTAALGTALAVLIVLVSAFPLVFGLSGKRNPHDRLNGPPDAAAALQALRQPDDAIFADHLQRASLLQFYLPDHPRTYVPVPSRRSQFTLWDEKTDFRAMQGLCLAERDVLNDLRNVFGKAELVREFVVERKGFNPRRYFIYRVGG